MTKTLWETSKAMWEIQGYKTGALINASLPNICDLSCSNKENMNNRWCMYATWASSWWDVIQRKVLGMHCYLSQQRHTIPNLLGKIFRSVKSNLKERVCECQLKLWLLVCSFAMLSLMDKLQEECVCCGGNPKEDFKSVCCSKEA